MSMENRLAKLERDSGAGDVYKYMCVISEMDTPEERAKGYKVQPNGGDAGDPFYLATREELDTFGARPDVDLTIIVVGFEDDNEPGA